MKNVELKQSRTGIRRAMLALAGLALVLSSLTANAQPERGANGKSLEGTWIVSVVVQDCSSGATVAGPFQSLLTFADGGTLVETTSNPMFYPAERGPGHGVWSRNHEGTYAASSIAFITMNGVLQRTQVITQTIAMDSADQFHTTAATVKFLSPGGTLLSTGCAAAIGKRFQ